MKLFKFNKSRLRDLFQGELEEDLWSKIIATFGVIIWVVYLTILSFSVVSANIASISRIVPSILIWIGLLISIGAGAVGIQASRVNYPEEQIGKQKFLIDSALSFYKAGIYMATSLAMFPLLGILVAGILLLPWESTPPPPLWMISLLLLFLYLLILGKPLIRILKAIYIELEAATKAVLKMSSK